MSMMDDDSAEMRNISFAKSKKYGFACLNSFRLIYVSRIRLNYDDAAKLTSFVRFFSKEILFFLSRWERWWWQFLFTSSCSLYQEHRWGIATTKERGMKSTGKKYKRKNNGN